MSEACRAKSGPSAPDRAARVIRQLAVGAVKSFDGVSETAQGGDRGLFVRGDIGFSPLLRELRDIQQNQAKGNQPPAAVFADKTELRLLAIDHGDRDERKILVKAQISKTKFSGDCGVWQRRTM